MVDEGTVSAFMALFVGNSRSRGVYNPSREPDPMYTSSSAYCVDDIRAHLDGEIGVGMVPVLDDGSVRFAAIDIDAHDTEMPEVDVVALEARVRALDLPLMVCRSKGRGAHLYCFMEPDVPAARVRAALASWASKLGYPSVEVFPKQSHLRERKDGSRPLGNWINLPYFGDTRRCVEGGREISLEHFLEIASTRLQRAADFDLATASGEHSEAPPCLQRMMLDGVPKGEGLRNRALFHASVYFRRAFPDSWRDRAFDFNTRSMDEPLLHAEAKKTVDSVAKREYQYKCKEEPCAMLCDRAACLTRKFGITEASASADIPKFTNLRKFNTDPVKWQLDVNEKTVTLSSEELTTWRAVRLRIIEVLHTIPPHLKIDAWDDILRTLIETVETVEVSDETSTPGYMRVRLLEWLRRSSDGDTDKGRQALLRGVPVITTLNNENVVAFRYQDFVDYLKRTRSEELKGVNLWMALQKAGIKSGRMRVGVQVVNVWTMPAPAEDVSMDTLTYKPDL